VSLDGLSTLKPIPSKEQPAMKRYLVSLISFFTLLLTPSCGTTTTNQALLSISPPSSSLIAGGVAVTFKAIPKNTSGDVTWTLSPNLGALSSNQGLDVNYTPPASVAEPTIVTLTALLGNLTAAATLTINPAPGFIVTGKVQAYSAGAASLTAITNDSATLPPITVATGQIEANGSFSLTLPETLEEGLLTSSQTRCEGVTATPSSFNVAQVNSLDVVKDGRRIGELRHASSLDLFGSSIAAYIYVDRDVKIIGTCQADGFSYNYNLDLKKGWNLELDTIGETLFSYTTPKSVDLPWLFSLSTSEDTIPPTVVSIDPPDGAKGVKDDARIVITFSETMDQAATEDALQRSLNFPSLTYSWNVEGTVLTIQPNDFLEYAAGDDPNIPAITYELSLLHTAKDVAGNALEAFSSSFSTLKVIVTSIYGAADLDGEVNDGGGVNSVRNYFIVGDVGTGGGTFRGFVSFDLTSIPAGVVADEANLIINKQEITGNPYELASVSLDHVNYGASLSGNDYDTPMLADLGVFDSSSAPVTGYGSSDVTSAVNDDLANRVDRGNRSQYRLRFPSLSNNGDSDFISFTASEGLSGQRPFLNIVYYIP
jgi:Bacterial Ig-like domain